MTATTAQPGSEAKIQVLERRYENGEDLFQCGDCVVGCDRECGGHGGPAASFVSASRRGDAETPPVAMCDFDEDDDFNA